ncbi:glutamate--ammonia ligase [Serendipita sp. 398]|nr:glutamate--ammonia ligase [Serendipita sp. 398]
MSAAYLHKPELLQRYLQLDQGGKIQAEYVWIDGDGGLRCKTTTVNKTVKDIGDLRIWDFDGSSTNQAPGHDSDVYLRPAAIFKDPFRGGDNILVLAETYNNDGTPNKTNYRHHAKKIMEQVTEIEPWFGLEQEYTLFDVDDKPYQWPKGGFPGPQGPYYCGVGTLFRSSSPNCVPSRLLPFNGTPPRIPSCPCPVFTEFDSLGCEILTFYRYRDWQGLCA